MPFREPPLLFYYSRQYLNFVSRSTRWGLASSRWMALSKMDGLVLIFGIESEMKECVVWVTNLDIVSIIDSIALHLFTARTSTNLPSSQLLFVYQPTVKRLEVSAVHSFIGESSLAPSLIHWDLENKKRDVVHSFSVVDREIRLNISTCCKRLKTRTTTTILSANTDAIGFHWLRYDPSNQTRQELFLQPSYNTTHWIRYNTQYYKIKWRPCS